MDANNKFLVITRPDTSSVEVRRAFGESEDIAKMSTVTTLWSVLRGKFNGAKIVNMDSSICEVKEVHLLGIANRASFGAPLWAYILLLLIGVFTLAIPVKIRLILTQPSHLDIAEIKEYLKLQINRNPKCYMSYSSEQLEKLISRANSMEMLVAMMSPD